MGHLPKLIEDLALILIVAAFVVLIFRKIKQPLVLGYIIAGFLVGPYFKLVPTVVDYSNVKTWAEIGVIFLLFSLGLEFSFKKLLNVGGSASITAFVEIIFITIAGYFVGKALGWSTMDSIFLGGMLASSSTTIIIRAFDELGVKTKQFARTVFGVLVVEDIVVILLMVLLSTIAVTNQFEGMQIVLTVVKLVFFLILWFVLGIFLLPTLFQKIRNLIDDEILLILSIGLCLGMVLLATSVGFSAELGAFIMGSIIAETTKAEKVEHVFKSVKDLFGAVFFISVGMMIDPTAMYTYGLPILAVTFLTIFGKMFSSIIGALISGQPLKQSVQVGMSMAQIGEFAFIVATLGLSLGVISDFLFPIAVGVSAITTFTTPYLIKLSEPTYLWLEKVIPPKILKRINSYSSDAQSIQAESNWNKVLKEYGRIMMINGTIVVGLVLVFYKFVIPFISLNIENEHLQMFIKIVLPLMISGPFLWAFMVKKPESKSYKELWLRKKYNRGPLLILEIFRFSVGILFLGLIIDRLGSTWVAFAIIIPLAVIFMYVFSNRINKFYKNIENRFITNFNQRETNAEAQKDPLIKKNKELFGGLATWDIHIVELQVHPLAEYVGIPLHKLQWREQYGINIAYIKRGDKLIHTPDHNQILYPYDRVGIISTDDQINVFKPVFDASEVLNDEMQIEKVKLKKILIKDYSKLKGKSIKDSGVRAQTNGLVIAIIRGEERFFNPESDTILQADDIIWVVGDKEKLEGF